jgi:homoserine kinase
MKLEVPHYIRFPASVGNVGPGFDALGLALQFHLTVFVEPASEWQVTVEGESAEDLPADETNRVIQMARLAAERWNVQLPPLRVEIVNEIPVQRGLGGSGASALAGFALASLFRRTQTQTQEYLDLAAEVEGHLDNVAASLLGGLVACYHAPDGRLYALSGRVPRPIRVLSLWPSWKMETAKMRRILPETYPRDVVVRQLQRVAAILAYWQERDDVPPKDFFYDEVHQPYRLEKMPEVRKVIDLASSMGLPALLSGAGPAVAILTTGAAAASEFLEALAQDRTYRSWSWRFERVDRRGLVVRPYRPLMKKRILDTVQKSRPVTDTKVPAV